MSISKRVEEILFLRKLDQMGLTPMWEYICRTNPAKINAYHNTEHMFGVAQLAWKIWNVEVGEEQRASDSEDYTFLEVIIASLWHDYDHSGGYQPDVENISDALAALETWLDLPEYKDVADNLGLYYDDGGTLERVRQLITVTEFPFVHEPRFIAEKIIRDADLLYSFSDATGPILNGLYTELASAGKFPPEVTFQRMVEGQAKFHDEVQLFTHTGLAIHRELKQAVIKEQTKYGQQLLALEKT